MIKVINRKKNRSNESLVRSKKKTPGKWLYRLVAFFFFLTVGFALFFSDFLTIVEVEISGLDKLEEMPVRSIVDEKRAEKYFNLVSKNNLVLFPGNGLEKTLLEKFKRIESVRIKRIFPHKIELAIGERKFTMLLCSSGQCFLLNERGEVYPADNFSSEELEKENLITLSDLSNAKISFDGVSLGNSPLEDDFREFIVDLAGRVLEDVGIVLKKQYETPSRMSGDLKAETEEGWKIYFGASVGMEKELLMLRTVLERKIEKDQQKNLEYIDLRIANKVFYKFKEGTEQTQEVEAVSAPEVKKEEKKKKK
jgi:cell division septal protein FtsQ